MTLKTDTQTAKISEKQIFEKISEAISTHTAGVYTEVMYDVKNNEVYIALRASSNSWERDEDGYCPASIFAIQSHESEFELCEMLNYDLQWERDENPGEYEKDNDAFDAKCLKEALESVNFEEWKNFDDIVQSIEDARNLFDDEEEDDSQ